MSVAWQHEWLPNLLRYCMEYGATVWDPYQKYNREKIEKVHCIAVRFVKIRYASVSDMFDAVCWPRLSQMRQEARIFLYKIIINGFG